MRKKNYFQPIMLPYKLKARTSLLALSDVKQDRTFSSETTQSQSGDSEEPATQGFNLRGNVW